jgi:tetratricopeptide (TPR) repeat protein
MLLREAQIIGRLNHPNIVTVHDAGIVGDCVYVAMEFVEGETIAAWLRAKAPAWPEIVDVFLSAGRGLAAAHDASVVHRDFKPQNVMIGTDGRVRVMDFGLARPLRGAEGAPAGASPALTDSLVSAAMGALVGTPAYMAPEQLRGERSDPRSDQFSFCVALHEGIYSVRPGVAAETGAARTARRVPPWLRAVVRRGLEPDPEKRFPSMHDLLRALGRGERRGRKLAMLGAGVLLPIAAIAVARMSMPQRFSCAPPQDRIQAIWPASESAGSRRSVLHGLFRATGLPDAEETWVRLAATLDEHVRDWTVMYKDACEATNLRGEQSTEALDLRMTCLNDNLNELRAYSDELSSSDPLAFGRVLATAEALTPVKRCADVKTLRLQVPLPADARLRDKVQELRQRLKAINTVVALRSGSKARPLLLALEPEVRAIGYRPLQAEFWLKLGWVESQLESPVASRGDLEQALFAAESSHDDLTAARAAELLGYADTIFGKYDEARQWLSFAQSVIDRIHAQGTLTQAWILNEWGNFYYAQGDFPAAEKVEREAIELKTSLLGASNPDLAGSLSNLASVLDEEGEWTEALALSTRSLRIFEQYSGGDPVVLANGLNTEGQVLLHMGRLDQAEVDFRRALELGKAGYEEVITLNDLAEVDLARHRAPEALDLARQAMQLADKNELSLFFIGASPRFTLARAVLAVKKDKRQSRALAFQACEGFEAPGLSRRRAQVLSWFSQIFQRSKGRPATSCADLQRGEAHSS